MNSSFLQKVVITIVAGFAFACLIEFYKNFIIGADRAVNGGYKSSHTLSN